jgi:N-acyl-D-amino-acid deacylase
MIVAPGFVDFRTSSPSEALLAQGVTTVILGSDGSGPYSIEDFMLPFDEKPPAVNIAMLVGHGTVRRQIMGPDYKRAAVADELERMSELISDAMKQGAFGLGSDLRSEPASFSTPAELMALAKTMARFGGTLAINPRSEDATGVKEAIAIARDAKIPVQIFTSNKAALAEIDKARIQKIDISADSYSFEQFTRDKTITLERAMQRLAAPASRFGLRERGILKKGAPADIVVFSSQALSTGMKYVLVNGVVEFREGQPTDARSGQALR